MPQKIPSIGDAGLDAHGAGPAHSSKDPGTRLGRAFAQLTTTIEDNLEKALDMCALVVLIRPIAASMSTVYEVWAYPSQAAGTFD